MPTAPDNAYPIKTIVVLVQENRSFDHVLGWMKSLNPEINGVDGTQSNPLSTSDPSSHRVRFADRAAYVAPDPGHSIGNIYEQIFGAQFNPSAGNVVKTPLMDGFAQNAERVKQGLSEEVMNGFLPDAVPVYKDLVAEFAVCDRWFASVPASTQPNRQFVHSATSQGLTSNDTKRLVEGLPQRTIFDALDEEGRTFGIYYQYPPSTLFYRNLRKLKYIGKFHEFDLDFKRHCREGKLPNYVVVEQRYFDLKILPGNDDHPSHDVLEGQKFVKEVYEALRSSPQWNEILFVIIYDEHGGFYDHVPTPVDGVPSPDGMVGPAPFNFRFDRLGVRIPAMLISPWIERGTVLHGPSGPSPTSEFEHSSIPATVKKIFNLKDFLTKRDEWAGTFETVLTRQTPRTDCPENLPEPKKLQPSDIDESAKPRELAEELVEVGDGDARESAKLSEFQRELVQMAAVLCGDHHKDIYPDKLVENMTVADGARYMKDAFRVFLGHCEERRKNGADESEVMVVGSRAETETERPQTQKKKSFANKFFACLACNHS